MENNAESENPKGKGKGIPIHGGKYVRYNILGSHFQVYSKYAPPLQPVGRGAYGIVWFAHSLNPQLPSFFILSAYLLILLEM